MKQLRKSEIKELNAKIAWLGIELSKKSKINQEENFYYENNEISFFDYKNTLFPSIKIILKKPEIIERFKKVVVDMGAVRFVVNGADILRPGIVSFDETLKKDDPVIILDESHGKPIAIGIAIYSATDMKKQQNGKAVKNIHYVGDHIWKSDSNS